MLRQDVGKVLGHPISNVASFAQIIEDHSRDAGNTQRIMRDLIAVCLTKLEELEPALEKGEHLISEVPEQEETITKYGPNKETVRPS